MLGDRNFTSNLILDFGNIIGGKVMLDQVILQCCPKFSKLSEELLCDDCMISVLPGSYNYAGLSLAQD